MLKIGVPIEIAESWHPYEIMAVQVISGELEGGEFDWDSLSWRDTT